ncbi:unnamed protein product [Dracunculus medinensis]|uniref:Uncharacterized protein n=1 Tax=Dracunculus medinensis TaxID=318479 RepID=A0A0N4UFG0_DRAME|nr:unnamed protein product [Dracunculus medinensis]
MRLEFYPEFKLYVHIGEFRNIDLSRRGYYQIRFKLKSTLPSTINVYYERASCPNVVYPPCVVEGYLLLIKFFLYCAISKTVEIIFADEILTIDDCFYCIINVRKHIESFKILPLQMIVELFFLDRIFPPKYIFCLFFRFESFSAIAQRVLNISLRVDRSFHAYRPLFFGYSSFSVVALIFHASLISISNANRRQSPYLIKNSKMYEIHRCICEVTLLTYRSMQIFMDKYSKLLSSPLTIDIIDVENRSRQCLLALQSSENPLIKLEEDRKCLSQFLFKLFSQLIQAFSRSRELATALYDEYCHIRIKRLGEGFFFLDDGVQSLLAKDDSYQIVSKITNLIKKEPYFYSLPRTDLHCEGIDIDSSNITSIIEWRYLPSNVSQQKSVDRSDTSWAEKRTTVKSNRQYAKLNGFCFPLSSTSEEPYKLSKSISSRSFKSVGF